MDILHSDCADFFDFLFIMEWFVVKNVRHFDMLSVTMLTKYNEAPRQAQCET